MTPAQLAILHREIERDRLLDTHINLALASYTRDPDTRDAHHSRGRAHMARATKHRAAYRRLEEAPMPHPRRSLLAALALLALVLLLAGCTTVVQAPPEPELGEPVVIDLCNTTVCQPWRDWRPHPQPHHHERLEGQKER